MTRGTSYEINKFIDVMQGNMLPWKTDKGNYSVQLSMRPVQLWECVFPKECLPNILKGINFVENRKDINIQNIALRKALNSKKIPKLDLKDVQPINCHMDNIAVYPIGIREDKNVWKEGKYKGAEQL
tara:strand:- start:468 stop:848 length:381 start_codon:yes stop_codon:yes gene_type:complete